MKQVIKNGLLNVSLLLIVIFMIDNSSPAEYAYDEAYLWPRIYPECGGQRQSPITWTWDDFIDEDPDDFFTFVNYQSGPLSANILNDGHMVKVRFQWDESVRPFLTGGILKENEYVLESIHLHWNSRSEQGAVHCFVGNCDVMELHLVHYNRKYGSYENSLNFTDGLVIHGSSIRYRDPINHPTIPISDIMSKARLISTPKSSIDIEPFNMSDINLRRRKQGIFLAYLGSLTAPPCTENVLWLLNFDPLHVNMEEINLFKSLIKFDHGDHKNVRPAQPLNGRTFTIVWAYGDIIV